MKVLVIDVAAEHGGAATILDQFVDEFKNNGDNQYLVVLSKIYYSNEPNIEFKNLEWVKKSYIHRLYFDIFYVKRLIKDFSPDLVLSLQNKAVNSSGLRQEVYFQNALPIAEKKFSLSESKTLWVYQNIIGRIIKHSLHKADIIYVQAQWMKDALSERWHIDKKRIIVKRPFMVNKVDLDVECDLNVVEDIFYPAASALYKNHIVLFKAMKRVWDEIGKSPKLIVTTEKEALSHQYAEAFGDEKYPVVFLGRLDKNEMKVQYKKSLLVFPSYIETVGLPLMEASMLKCKIIAADCAYAHEVLDEYKDACFFDPFDDLKLATLIKEAIIAH